MSKWDIRGPVHTVRTQSEHSHHLVIYLPDGKISASEYRNLNGSITRSNYIYDSFGRLEEIRFDLDGAPTGRSVCFYDERGRLTRVVEVNLDGAERESQTCTYSPDGRRTRSVFAAPPHPDAKLTTFALRPDEDDEVLLYDHQHRLQQRVLLTRDSTGRLVREESQNPHPVLSKFVNITTYTHDQQGRLLERRSRMGELSDRRTTFLYADNDDPIEETSQDLSREMWMDEQGDLHPTKENSTSHTTRFSYIYDDQGNWTERSTNNFDPSTTEHREITYYSTPA